MARLREFDVNTRVELEVHDPDFEGKYASRVMDVTKKEIELMAPTEKGELVPIRRKTKVTIDYIGQRAMYRFDSIITRRFRDPVAGIAIKKPRRVERIQRREFVRLEINIPIKYRLSVEEGEPEEFKKSYTIDLSGGGLRFISDEKLPEDEFLEIRLGMDRVNEVIFGKIARVAQTEDNDGYEIGLEFKSLSPATQDEIVSWIFNKQREMIRKGLA